MRNPTRTMIKISLFKDFRNGDDGLQVNELEAFVNGPVRLQGLEPTLNRLVSVFYIYTVYGTYLGVYFFPCLLKWGFGLLGVIEQVVGSGFVRWGDSVAA